jgi:hypothetical protein
LLLSVGAASATIAQPAPHTWMVDPRQSPKTLAEAVQASGPGDVIVLAANANPYAGGVALKERQTLLGAGEAAAARLRSLGIAVPQGLAAAAKPSIVGEPITLGAGNTIVGIAFRPSHLAIIGAPSQATRISDISIDGGDGGVVLQKATGTVSIERATIGETSGPGISVDDGENLTFSYVTLMHAANKNLGTAVACASDVINGTTAACNAAISLRDARNVALDHITVDGGAQIGINGENVSGLTIRDSEIRSAGNEPFESGIQLRNLSGDAAITGTSIHDNAARQIYIANGHGELRLTIEQSSFKGGPAANGQQGALFSFFGSAVGSVTIRGTSLTNNAGNGLQTSIAGRARVTVTVERCTLDHNAGGIIMAAGGEGRLALTIKDSVLTASSLPPITVSALAPGKPIVSGVISGNTIGKNGAVASGARCGGCNGIAIDSGGAAQLRLTVTGNIVQQIDGAGIVAAARGASSLSVAITGNTIRQPVDSAADAIRLQAGASRSDTATLCAELGGPGPRKNTIVDAWSPAGAILVRNRFAGTTLRLAGYNGGGQDLAALGRFLADRNGGATVKAILGTGNDVNSFSGGESCMKP